MGRRHAISDADWNRIKDILAGCKKTDGSGGQQEQDLGRSRGGFGTKGHVAVSGLGLRVELLLSPGQAADATHAAEVLTDHRPAVVIGDKGYDSDALVRKIRRRGAEALIPSKKNRRVPRVIDRVQHKERNLVERFWAKAKVYRRVATRYEKKSRNFLAFVQVASIMILLR